MRSLHVLFVVLVAGLSSATAIVSAACGRGDVGTSPTPIPSDPTFSIRGTVVRIVTNEPIAGARVGGLQTVVTTSADGSFVLTPGAGAVATSPLRLTIDAPGYVTREMNVRVEAGGRSDLVIDLMGQAPFALPFFEEFARDRLDNRGQLRALAPMAAPRYLLVTRYADGGAVSPALLERVRAAVAEMADAFSGGRAQPRITESESVPGGNVGQIVVTFSQDASSSICGQATVGVETGFVRFYQRVPACACADSEDGLAPAIIRHELGHTLGAYHVSDDVALMNTEPRCSAAPTALERFHASVLFRRPRGNTSPDVDPPGVVAQTLGEASAACRLSRLR